MTITLYLAPMSSATPVAWALTELDVPHERIAIDLAANEQKRPELLALNPNGKVPTLEVDGTPMFEALAIMQWLGDRFGVQRGMWPALDAPARLEALSWTTWAYVSYSAVVQRLNLAASDRVAPELRHAAQAKVAHQELQELLAILDGRLESKGGFVLGRAFSLADLIVTCAITYSTYCGVPVDDHANVQAWMARCHDRPSFTKEWA
jgi:glutathione S-transferase